MDETTLQEVFKRLRDFKEAKKYANSITIKLSYSRDKLVAHIIPDEGYIITGLDNETGGDKMASDESLGKLEGINVRKI